MVVILSTAEGASPCAVVIVTAVAAIGGTTICGAGFGIGVGVYCPDRLAGNFSLNIGRLMEEVVASYYFRRRMINPNLDFYYWKDERGREVDFVLMENLKVVRLIQVSYVSSLTDISERELVALEKASDELDCKNLDLITWDLTGEIVRKNKKIICYPLKDFLLE